MLSAKSACCGSAGAAVAPIAAATGGAVRHSFSLRSKFRRRLTSSSNSTFPWKEGIYAQGTKDPSRQVEAQDTGYSEAMYQRKKVHE